MTNVHLKISAKDRSPQQLIFDDLIEAWASASYTAQTLSRQGGEHLQEQWVGQVGQFQTAAPWTLFTHVGELSQSLLIK